MPDAAFPDQRRKKTPRTVTPEEAREKILTKLRRGGSKGTVALLPKTGSAVFVEVIAALEAGNALFVDRRKARPRYYAWESRPELPSVESVSAELLQYADAQFPLLFSSTAFKKHLGKARDKVALLEQALEWLTKGNELLALQHRAGKKELFLYASAHALRRRLDVSPSMPPAAEDRLRSSYLEIVRRSGFPAVTIAELQRASGWPLEQVKEWLMEGHRSGRVVLSLGDWSLASDEERAAAIALGGERYLQTRLLE